MCVCVCVLCVCVVCHCVNNLYDTEIVYRVFHSFKNNKQYIYSLFTVKEEYLHC